MHIRFCQEVIRDEIAQWHAVSIQTKVPEWRSRGRQTCYAAVDATRGVREKAETAAVPGADIDDE